MNPTVTFAFIIFLTHSVSQIDSQIFANRNIRKIHSGASGNSDKIIFPDEYDSVKRFGRDEQHQQPLSDSPAAYLPSAEESPADTEPEMGIPLELLERINEIQDQETFFREILNGSMSETEEAFRSRFGNVERSAAIKAEPARCIPELKVVSLVENKDKTDINTLYFPSCTRINRCSGCCNTKQLRCEPVQTESKTFSVAKSRFTGGKFVDAGKEIVILEEHLACKCMCAVKPEHCNGNQEYNKSGCRCQCKNKDEQNQCQNQSNIKIWDPSTCLCRCKEAQDCTTGTFFDESRCQCLPNSFYSWSN